MRGGDVYQVRQVDTHPQANFGKNEMYDLAVMTLSKPIQFSDSVHPIEFAKKQVDGPLTVSGGGWGVNAKDEFEPVLQTFTINMVPTDWCQQKLKMTSVAAPNRAALMCFTPKTGTPCAGDSGSGLWTPAANGQKAQLIGVLHGGVACSMERGTSLYVNVLNENHRSFLSKFFDMSGVPVSANPPPGEDLNTLINRENRSPGGITKRTYDMLDFLGVKLS